MSRVDRYLRVSVVACDVSLRVPKGPEPGGGRGRDVSLEGRRWPENASMPVDDAENVLLVLVSGACGGNRRGVAGSEIGWLVSQRSASGDAGHQGRRRGHLLDVAADGPGRNLRVAVGVGGEWRQREQMVEASGEVALEAAQRAALGLALALFAREVLAGDRVVLARVIAMMCSAWLSWRSPPRLSRCCVRCPEEQGIGAVPDCSAKLASDLNRSAPAVRPIRIAAVSAPQPSPRAAAGGAPDEDAQLALRARRPGGSGCGSA